jgi:tripartite-type tricarboxylate transporter receptor subunit TctC
VAEGMAMDIGRANVRHRGHALWRVIAAVACIPWLAAAASAANDYPTRTVRIIVPYGAGGIADVTMRLTAQKLSERLGQQFIVDNRPGAGGVLGARAAASATPDGYTLSMIGGGLTIAKSLFKSLPYDLVEDFVPISTTASYGLVIVAKADSGLKSVGDIIAAAKANPGKLNFGTINPGSNQHLAAELFRSMTQVDIAMIPHKTTPDLITALLRGDIDIVFEYEAGLGAMMTDPRVAVVAYTGPARMPHLPNLSTVAESGLPGYDVTSWNGLAAPKATPREIVDLLSRSVVEAMAEPDIKSAMAKFGMEARGSTSEELGARIRTDIAKWADVIEKAGIPKK